jgi:hypothetical protein
MAVFFGKLSKISGMPLKRYQNIVLFVLVVLPCEPLNSEELASIPPIRLSMESNNSFI